MEYLRPLTEETAAKEKANKEATTEERPQTNTPQIGTNNTVVTKIEASKATETKGVRLWVGKDGTVLADRELLKCPIPQKPAKNGTRP